MEDLLRRYEASLRPGPIDRVPEEIREQHPRQGPPERQEQRALPHPPKAAEPGVHVHLQERELFLLECD